MNDVMTAPAKAGRRPKMRRPGLINMKLLAIKFGPLFAGEDPFFMDHIEEMVNLSNGERTIAEIARIIAYEIGPVEPAVVLSMFEELARLDFLTLENGPAGQDL